MSQTDGGLRWLRATWETLFEHDEPVRMVGTVEDITERKRAEQALRESERRLLLHLRNTPLAVIEWDAQLTVTRWAGHAEATFGWSEDEALGKRLTDLHTIYEPDLPLVEATIAKLSDGVTLQAVSSHRNRTKDGRVIDCTWHHSVLPGADGAPGR